MEHLEANLEELEEAYENFYRKTVEAANYAEASGEYHGEMFDVLGEKLFQPELFDLEEKREQAVEQARRLGDEVDDYLFQLSGDIQAFTDGMDETPERAGEIDSRMGEIRAMYNELDEELKIIAGEKVPEDYVDEYEVQNANAQAEALHEQLQHIDAEGL